jgi:predicted ATPase/DNA-binding SARP family transcriptional activator
VLIDLLWAEDDLDAARLKLRLALTSLRRQLEPPGVPTGSVLAADRFAVRLAPSAVTTDVAEFETALQDAARAGSALEQTLRIVQAVELYHGELLPGHYEDWILVERERLAEAYLQALRRSILHLEHSRDLQRAMDYARRAVSADPLREESHRELMRLLAVSGQTSAALQQYRELERLLAAELGETPSAATRQLALLLETQVQTSDSATPTLDAPAQAAGRAGTSGQPIAVDAPIPLPVGTVTFLLTDIEGSTALWERFGELFKTALTDHHTLLRREIRRHRGYEVLEGGDSFVVAFSRAADALTCAVAGQRALTAHAWPAEMGHLDVRMALHTGDVELEAESYHGLVLHHASRMLVAAHGGQILCSEITAGLLQRGALERGDPGVRLTDLGVYRLRDVATPERLFQVEHPDLPRREFPRLNAEIGYTSNLPVQFTRFFGREKEIAHLLEMVRTEQMRIVTLTGPGGSGKTRLALQVAERLVEERQGAVWFVPLADVSAPELLPEAIRDALRLPSSPQMEAFEQVVQFLSRQPSLLVLDNFDYLVEEGAPLVRALLERVGTLQCLVTSRRRLDLEGERWLVVPPLAMPNGAESPERLSLYASVELFVDRAQAVQPDFQVTNASAAAVAELCQRLEGIPLAIELAAGRANILSPTQMLAHLEHRLDFLSTRRRDATARHRTLRAAIDWSYELLAPEVQCFFARLSVFRGGWTLEAAEAVCVAGEPVLAGPALDYLEQLRDCSLIIVAGSGEQVRFRMLETLREYGWEKLQETAESTAVCERHGEFFLRLSERPSGTVRFSPEWFAYLDRLEEEHDNLRAALQSSLPSAPERGIELIVRLSGLWQDRGYWTEARRWLALGLQRADPDTPLSLRDQLLATTCDLAQRQGDASAAKAAALQRLELIRSAGDRRRLFWVLWAAANLALDQNEIAQAQAFVDESRALCEELGDRHRSAETLRLACRVAEKQGDLATAQALIEQCLTLRRELGDRSGMSGVCMKAGLLALAQDEGERARAYLEEGLALAREFGNQIQIADGVQLLARVERGERAYEKARALLEESLALFREIQHQGGIASRLRDLGEVALEQGDFAAADVYLREALARFEVLGYRSNISTVATLLDRLAAEQGSASSPLSGD